MVDVFCIRSEIRSLENMKNSLHVFGFLSYINFPAHLEKNAWCHLSIVLMEKRKIN